MAGPFVADRVKETTLTGGTGTINLEGASPGFQEFLTGIGDTNSVYYMITDGIDWEVGIGTVVAGLPNQLVRNSGSNVVLRSSQGGAVITFPTGSKEVLGALPEDLAQPSYVKVGLSVGISVPDGAGFAVLDWDADVENTYAMHDLGVNPSRLTAKKAGIYEVFVGGPWAANAVNRRELEIFKDGAVSITGDSRPAAPSLETRHALSVPVRFALNEFVEVRARQDSGGPLVFGSAGLNTYFGMRRIGR